MDRQCGTARLVRKAGGSRVGGMRIYFMSICGTGMGNGALLMRALGHEVTGADRGAYPPMSERLAEAGVEVWEGYDAERLARLKPDLVVVGNVNTRGNPEVEWLLAERKVRYVSLPELLAGEVLSRRRTVVVTGTHGKTTTSGLAAHLLRAAGVPAGYLIGGVARDLPGGAEAGEAEAPFVIEGDEYDSAFFDKRSKFIHYCPRVLVVNNLEFDHADIFRDLKDIKRSFRHVLKLVPRNGVILANGDDPEVESLLHVDWAPVVRVGEGERAVLRIRDFTEGPSGSRFRLEWQGREWATVEWGLSGFFNARNAAMAAAAGAFACGLEDPTAFPLEALGTFRGIRCRQEVLLDDKRVTVMRDFGHHPTAVAGTLLALRARYPEHRLVVSLEARSNTACRRIHEASFELALDRADRVHLGEVFRPERYSEADRIDFAGMAARLGNKATAHADNRVLEATVVQEVEEEPPQLMVFFSNGSFDGVPERVAAALGTGGPGGR